MLEVLLLLGPLCLFIISVDLGLVGGASGLFGLLASMISILELLLFISLLGSLLIDLGLCLVFLRLSILATALLDGSLTGTLHDG